MPVRESELTVASWTDVDDKIPNREDAEVMVDMKEAHLTEIGIDDHQERVHELRNLREIENPANSRHLLNVNTWHICMRAYVRALPRGLKRKSRRHCKRACSCSSALDASSQSS